MSDEMVKLGVLWKNLSRNGGKPYLSGRVQQDTLEEALQLLREGGRLLVLGNNKRPDRKDPDCALFVVPERQAAPEPEPPATRTTTRPERTTRRQEPGGRA